MMLCSQRTRTILLIISSAMFAAEIQSTTTSGILRKKRAPSEEEQSQQAICDRFSMPLSKNNTFFSPINEFDDNYPPKADCILILTAPPGKVIKLDFRNRFAIEPSLNCEYDYLEIRDGKFGFSNNKSPFGRYCGKNFPEEIFSSDGYMWLKFHSDDNIEYQGFEGVFEFMERPKKSEALDECYFEQRNEIEGTISNTDINATTLDRMKDSKSNLDCLWMIEVQAGSQIMLSVETFELKKKNDCESNFVDIIGDDTNVSEPKKHFCGVVAEAYESKSNRLHVRFFATVDGIDSQFKLSYTAYTKKRSIDGKNTTISCAEDEFDCDDDTCIAQSLACNGKPNCKFKKDEANCGANEGQSKDLWVIIAVFSALLGAMTSVFLFNCIRTLVRDQKIIRETIRQSKESKLDEAGRMSIKRSLENVNRIIPVATSYTIESTFKKIQNDDTEHIYRGAASVSSASDTANKMNRYAYNYRDELKKMIQNTPRDSLDNNSNERMAQYSNDGVCEIACQTRQSLFNADSFNKLHSNDSKSSSFGPYNEREHETSVRGTTSGIPELPNISDKYNRSGSRAPSLFNPGGMSAQRTPSLASSSNTESSRMFENNPRDAVKMEHAQLMLDVRNSAPDVIIMTSQ